MELYHFIIIIALFFVIIPNLRFIQENRKFRKFLKWLNKYVKIESLWHGIEIAGILISIIALIYSFNDSKRTSEQTEKAVQNSDSSLKYTKLANQLAEISSMQSKLISQQTLSLLDSISNSSSSLNSSMDSFSVKISFINKYLSELQTNLTSINKVSNNIDSSLKLQLKNIQIKDSLEKAEKLKKPNIGFYIKCDFENNSFMLFIKNIGDTDGRIDYTWHWEQQNYKNEQTIELKPKGEYPVHSFNNNYYFNGDSIRIPITYTYNGIGENKYSSGIIKIEYVKCY